MKLLTLLFLCHFMGDFCLTSPWMLCAKSTGWPPLPILTHALIHAVLMGGALMICSVPARQTFLLAGVEMGSHFLIDTFKGLVNGRFPSLGEYKSKISWTVFGLDQFCHTLVILFIFRYAGTSLSYF